MNHPNTTREALLAEAIGDLGQLLDRLERVQKLMIGADEHFMRSALTLRNQSIAFQRQVQELQQSTEQETKQRITAHANQQAEDMVGRQTEAMTAAANKLFADLLRPSMTRLIGPLDKLFERLDHPWHRWFSHALTALFSAMLTYALLCYLAMR